MKINAGIIKFLKKLFDFIHKDSSLKNLSLSYVNIFLLKCTLKYVKLLLRSF